MLSDKKVILLGENIALEKFKNVNVAGIIGTCKSNEVDVYSYDYLVNLPDDRIVLIIDDTWEIERLHEFHRLMQSLGMCIGDQYIFKSMLECRVNTNVIYSFVDKDKPKFYDLMKKIMQNKKMVITWGNCQTHTLRNMLSCNEEFKSKYITCETPRLWIKKDENDWELFFESGILHLADYFFMQNVSLYNRFGYRMSSEYVLSQLSEQCKVITITNLHFMGYFPQLHHSHNEIDIYRGKIEWSGGINCIEKEVTKLICEGAEIKSSEEIVELISREDYFNRETLKQNIEAELRDFELREESIEIKMGDFLRQNYDKFLMFVTDMHPTRRVLEEFARRILKRLCISDMEIECGREEIQSPMPKDMAFVIYPSVLKAFDFPEKIYKMRVNLQGNELPVLMGVDRELDRIIEQNKNSDKTYSMTLNLDFQNYMMISVRVLQAAMHIG